MIPCARVARLRPGMLRALRTAAGIVTFGGLVTFATLGYNLSPGWYWLTLTAAVPAGAFFCLRRAYSLSMAREQARVRWLAHGPSVVRVRYTRFQALRRAYTDLTRDDSLGFVDDRTWDDLGMDGICDQMDVCFTMAGRNELYRMLRHSVPKAADARRRREQSAAIGSDPARREAIARVLAGVGEETDADPASVLWSDAVRPDRLYPLFVTMAALAVISVVIAATMQPTLGLICIVVVFVTNMWIYYRKARHISAYVPALRILSRMMTAARTLPAIVSRAAVPSGARGAFRWLLTGAPTPLPSFSGDILEMLFTYLKIFFQIDLIAYERIVGHILKNRDEYRALYQAVGSVDAAFALASCRARCATVCDAEIADAGKLAGGTVGPAAGSESRLVDMQNACHPLVADPVANSITLRKPGAIVTGTNMAGKSTFLRTVGINVICAQTAGFAFAERYRGVRLTVLSSINKRDDLEHGKSFYYDEAERIFRMIEGADGDVPALLLIDELLSGTNSLERESASLAILHYLAERNAVTVAATHDITIAAGMKDLYELYYFTDSAGQDGLTFDYRIQPGIVRSRNAIKLLRLIGYPESVIEAALERTDPDRVV